MLNPSVEEKPIGIRSWVNTHPVLATVLVIGAVALVLWLTHHSPPAIRVWYTSDDGATLFAHDYEVPPFTFHGQEAVQAYVYTCDKGQTHFTGYLMRFTPEGKEAMEKLLAERRKHHSNSPISFPDGVQVKRPGQGNWVERHGSSGSQEAMERGKRIESAIRSGMSPQKALSEADSYDQITHVTCPDGKGRPIIMDP
jgi:hypothetical protein